MSRRNKRNSVVGGRDANIHSIVQNMDQFASQLQQAAQFVRTEAKRLRSVLNTQSRTQVAQTSGQGTSQQRLSRRQRRAQRQQGFNAPQGWSQGKQPGIQNLTQVGQQIGNAVGQAIAQALKPSNGQGQRSTPVFNFGGNTKSKNSTAATYRS